MTRIYAILTVLALALFTVGCESNVNDTNDPDDTSTTPEVYEASFAASLNTYGWDGDAVILLDSTNLDKTVHGNGANYIATGNGQTVSGATPDLLELDAGVWTSSYFYGDYTIPYIGSASADLSTTSDLSATLCADLSGDWSCAYVGTDLEYETNNAVMNGCSIQLDGVTGFGSDWLQIDGNKIESSLSDGSTIRGIISTNTITMIAELRNDTTLQIVCN